MGPGQLIWNASAIEKALVLVVSPWSTPSFSHCEQLTPTLQKGAEDYVVQILFPR